jgi:hypothetical protein
MAKKSSVNPHVRQPTVGPHHAPHNTGGGMMRPGEGTTYTVPNPQNKGQTAEKRPASPDEHD